MSFTIFGKEGCKGCNMAKTLLTNRGLSFEYRDVVEEESFEEMSSSVLLATGNFPRTLPQIFKNGKYLGGFEDLYNSVMSQGDDNGK